MISLSPPANRSDASWLASLPEVERTRVLSEYSDDELAALQWDWDFWSRPAQQEPPGDWIVWLNLAGRGYGKTRTGAEWIRKRWKAGLARRMAFIAPTPADARDVMVEGESGILAISPPQERPIYEPSKRRLTWPDGAIATIFSAYEPDQLRGPNHDTIWGDEFAVWKYLRETWDMAMFGLRIGDQPRACLTTTPKPTSLLRELVQSPQTHVTVGSTFDNRANLAPTFLSQIVTKYEGTSLGEQELYARILDEAPGALWKRETISRHRVALAPPLVRIVVAIDPAATNTDESSETGIVVAGLGTDGHGYLLNDVSGRMSPQAWATKAVGEYETRQADRIIGETNNGGDMVEFTIRTVAPKASFKAVTASRGKHTRAEPVAALAEQGKIHHVGTFPQLEDQLCGWVPGEDSPDRLDAKVWAFTELMLGPDKQEAVPMHSMTAPSYWRTDGGQDDEG